MFINDPSFVCRETVIVENGEIDPTVIRYVTRTPYDIVHFQNPAVFQLRVTVTCSSCTFHPFHTRLA